MVWIRDHSECHKEAWSTPNATLVEDGQVFRRILPHLHDHFSRQVLLDLEVVHDVFVRDCIRVLLPFILPQRVELYRFPQEVLEL